MVAPPANCPAREGSPKIGAINPETVPNGIWEEYKTKQHWRDDNYMPGRLWKGGGIVEGLNG